jgi:hypothetical protein
LREEIERKEKKESVPDDNPSIKKQHALPGMEEDVVRNPMTWLKKFFGCRMKVHALSKRGGLSHFNFFIYFLITLKDQSTPQLTYL